MDIQLLNELARHQVWADEEHWKALRANAALLEDGEIRKRLNHMLTASNMLQTLARGEIPSFAPAPEREGEELAAAMRQANESLSTTLATVDLDKMIRLPRGPQGPFDAPAGVLMLQAITHGEHHRGQNAARMRALGIAPPMTDFVFWYALGRP